MNIPISPEFKRVFDLFRSGESQKHFKKLEYEVIPSFIELDWFISYRFLAVCDLEDLFYVTSPRGVDNSITSAFDTYKRKCKQSLLKNHRQRAKVLCEIFKCFDSKCYSSVIVLAYSTAEGLVHEAFGQKFWGGHDQKANRIHFEKLRDEQGVKGVLRMHYKRLSFRGTINAESKKITMNVDTSNNRHLVLHGQSYKYGSKKNAIKAILLLDFISELAYLRKNNMD
jgi:hypothetical protein